MAGTPQPVPRQRIFRGIPRDTDLSSSDDDSGQTYIPGWVRRRLFEEKLKKAHAASKRKRVHDDGNPSDQGLFAAAALGNNNSAMNIVDDKTDDEIISTKAQHQLHQEAMTANNPSTPAGRKGNKNMASGFGPGGLPTPWTGKGVPEASVVPSSKRLKNTEARAVAVASAAQNTPTPSRTRNALSSTFTSTPGGNNGNNIEGDEEITISVMGLLQGEDVSPQTQEALRTMLNSHARRARGVEQSRYLLRSEVKHLRDRVAELEEEQRVSRIASAKVAGELWALSQGSGTGTATRIGTQAEDEDEDGVN
ncbi:hypothetical protein VTJ49DRAFT_135 [Mycothermus thermophilus]|uniref:Uncharacterized protein n=1 Tax=Humicola insolens TaxID=85995 RepID=A0ABR3VQB8_HUMIN